MELAISRIEQDIAQGKDVSPSPTAIFKAFELTDPKNIKVVILGQDPYFNGEATGLAFGVEGSKIPPSLKIIHKELQYEYDHVDDNFDYSLEHWAKQGVLLLNTSFTVVKKAPASHAGLWDFVVDYALRLVQQNSPKAMFLLWGKHAKAYGSKINRTVLQAAHPAAEAYSAGGAGFYGCGHFVKTNEHLKAMGLEPINWFELPSKPTDEEQIEEYEETVKN